MLERLLSLLRSGGIHTVNDLARELETTPTLVEVMLEDLARRCYLGALDAHGSGKCAGCPVGGACSAGGRGRVWRLAPTPPLPPAPLPSPSGAGEGG